MEAPHLDRKLVAILAADIEGFSSHMERDEGGTLAVLSSHRLIIDASIAEFGGRITSTAGDSVLAEFASVVSVINCAMQIQDLLADENAKLDEAQRLFLRIGINVGDVMMKDGDIFGDGVNIAARLESLAEPGGICVSRGVRDHLRKHPIMFADLGEQKVRNIAQPVRAFKVSMGGTPDEVINPVLEATRVDGPSMTPTRRGRRRRTHQGQWKSRHVSCLSQKIPGRHLRGAGAYKHRCRRTLDFLWVKLPPLGSCSSARSGLPELSGLRDTG
jgi:class 3 adenylate cyclase